MLLNCHPAPGLPRLISPYAEGASLRVRASNAAGNHSARILHTSNNISLALGRRYGLPVGRKILVKDDRVLPQPQEFGNPNGTGGKHVKKT